MTRTDAKKPTNRFELHGPALLSSGYNCIPIIPHYADHKSAGKAPAFKHWQRSEFNQELLDAWKVRYRSYGVGIQTRFHPAVDIDCLDEDGVAHMVDFVEQRLGKTIKRVGRAPKILLLFRTDSPFTKVKSHVWVCENGDKHAVEILGSGQQFVAYGIHPGTKKPYKWIDAQHPAVIDADLDLPEITLEDAQSIAREFDRYARLVGWTPDKEHSSIDGSSEVDSWVAGEGLFDDEDWLTADDLINQWEGTVEELANIFEDLPAEESYDRWFPVLAALKDAERHPDEFKEIAHNWSAKATNFDEDAFDNKWDKGSFNRVTGRMLTLASIVRRVEKIRREDEIVDVIIPDFNRCITLKDWFRVAERLSEIEVFGVARDTAVEIATESYKRVANTKKVPRSALEQLAFDWKKFDAPEWLTKWMFNRQTGKFVDATNFQEVAAYSFNVENNRILREMNIRKDADKFVSEDFPIPVIDGVMYYPAMHGDMPGSKWYRTAEVTAHNLLEFQGKVYLNKFNPLTLPPMAESLTKADRRAIAVVDAFFKTQFPNEKEWRYAMDWLAWVINNPTKKILYALIVVGCEGSGKSIIKKMMQYLLGAANVGTISNVVLMTQYTDWAEGHILKVLEEVDIPGHRFDVVNTLKEPIANESLQTVGKYRSAGEHVNTASYLGFTNQPGAVPVDDDSRRYLVISSRFADRKEDLLPFMAKNPRFFKEFEHAFVRHAGAIRKWFSEWVYSDDFNSQGHAPSDTEAKDLMRTINKDTIAELLDTAISSGDYVGLTNDVLHASGVSQLLADNGHKTSSATARVLAKMGYTPPPGDRPRVRLNGVLGTVYVKNAAAFQKKHGSKTLAVAAEILRKHADDVEKQTFAE